MAGDLLQERLLFDITTPDPSIISDLAAIEDEDRNAALPTVYRYAAGVHPQLRGSSYTVDTGTIYVYLVDSSPAGVAKAKELAATIELPTGMINPPDGRNSTYTSRCFHVLCD